MADWRERSEVDGDVVFFQYVKENFEANQRQVFVWDLDKTYLDTTIDSLSGLFQTLMERAFSKKNVAGTRTLLQNLSEYQLKTMKADAFPIYFITASPPQMEERIAEKFEYDNLEPFGCFFKDNLRNLRPGRFWRLTKQVGYKLQALLQLRLRLHPEIKQICFGDDSESDATIYNLYSDICSRRIGHGEIRYFLEKLHVAGDQIETILKMQSHIPEMDPIERIYINLATDTDPDYYLKFGRRTLPTYNTFQVALDLAQNHNLGEEALYSVAQDMIYNYGFTPEELMKSFDELIRRRVIGATFFEKAKPFFIQKGLLYESYKPSMPAVIESKVENGKVFELEGDHEPWVPDRIDYLNDYR